MHPIEVVDEHYQVRLLNPDTISDVYQAEGDKPNTTITFRFPMSFSRSSRCYGGKAESTQLRVYNSMDNIRGQWMGSESPTNFDIKCLKHKASLGALDNMVDDDGEDGPLEIFDPEMTNELTDWLATRGVSTWRQLYLVGRIGMEKLLEEYTGTGEEEEADPLVFHLIEMFDKCLSENEIYWEDKDGRDEVCKVQKGNDAAGQTGAATELSGKDADPVVSEVPEPCAGADRVCTRRTKRKSNK